MVFLTPNPQFSAWLNSRLPDYHEPTPQDCSKVVQVSDGDIQVVTAVLFGSVAARLVSAALAPFTRSYVKAVFRAAFEDPSTRRVLHMVPEDDQQLINMNTRLGFQARGFLPDYFDVGRGGVLLDMTRSECRWIR